MKPEEAASLAADGDRYHKVNHQGIGTIADPVFRQLEVINRVSPVASVLEIGCTTGFRLEKAHQKFGARCSGLEISAAAVAEGRSLYPGLDLKQGAAPQDLRYWEGSSFDVIVVGHLLYLLPREDLFWFAAWVDRLLAVNGHVIINDFIYPSDTRSPYAHSDQLSVFKGDQIAPWTWNPQYFLVSREVYEISIESPTQRDPVNWQTVDTIRKLSIGQAYQNVAAPHSVHEDTGSG